MCESAVDALAGGPPARWPVREAGLGPGRKARGVERCGCPPAFTLVRLQSRWICPGARRVVGEGAEPGRTEEEGTGDGGVGAP